MLLYRPLIIDWLPVPLPHPPHQTSAAGFTHSVSVSLSHCLPLLIPSVSLSSLSYLLLFPSLPLSLFSFSLSAATLLRAVAALGSVLWCISILCCLLYCSWCAFKSRRSLLITHLSSSTALSGSSGSVSVNRSFFWCWSFMLCLET